MNIDSPFSIDGRVAIVTGGAEKLGAAMAASLSQAGAKVIITSRSQQKAERAAAEISQGEDLPRQKEWVSIESLSLQC